MRTGPFYSISSLGTDTADSVPLPPLPVPFHPQENAIPSREPSLDVRTDLKGCELSPAQPNPAEYCGPESSPVEWVAWERAARCSADNPGFGGICPSSLFCCCERPCGARCEMSTMLSLPWKKLCVTARVRKPLPSCLSSHVKMSHGGEHILCANHRLFCILLLLILLLLLLISSLLFVFSKLLLLHIVSVTRGGDRKGSHFLGV